MVTFAFFVVRHGTTDANEKGIIQGQSDYPLNDVGRRQAVQLAQHLRQAGQPVASFTHIYSSDLTRAKETAEILLKAKACDESSGPCSSMDTAADECRTKLICDERLRERKFGVLEGSTAAIRKQSGSKLRTSLTEQTPEGAESLRQLYDRVTQFFRDLCHQLSVASSVSSVGSRFTTFGRSPSAPSSPSGSGLPQASLCRNGGGGGGGGRSSQMARKVRRTNSLVPCLERHMDADRFNTDIGNSTGGRTSSFIASLVGQQASSATSEQQRAPAVGRTVSSSISNSADTVPNDDISLFTSSRDSGISAFSDGSLMIDTGLANAIAYNNDGPTRLFSVSTSSGLSTDSSTSPSCVWPESELNCQDSAFSVSSFGGHPLNAINGGSNGNGKSTDRRKRSLQSIASDDNNFPELDARVLVVSHGGVIRELFRFFVDELGCIMTGGRNSALRLCPNTGISSFMVHVDDDLDAGGVYPNGSISVVCLGLHSKEHLTVSAEDERSGPIVSVCVSDTAAGDFFEGGQFLEMPM